MDTLQSNASHGSLTEADAVLDEIRLKVNKEKISQQIDQFIGIISSDAFLGYVNDISVIPTYAERRRMTAETANLETLRRYGVPVVPELRLTTREFEVPEDGATAGGPLIGIRPGADPRMGVCVSVGFIVCVSYGS